MIEPEVICKKMKQIRKKNKLTQMEVAKNMGISRTMYAQIESGKKKMNMEHIAAFSEYFGMFLSDFFRECEEDIRKVTFEDIDISDIVQINDIKENYSE